MYVHDSHTFILVFKFDSVPITIRQPKVENVSGLTLWSPLWAVHINESYGQGMFVRFIPGVKNFKIVYLSKSFSHLQ